MVVFEDIAAPLLLFIHASSIVLSLGLWVTGTALLSKGVKTGNFEQQNLVAKIFLFGGIMLAALIITGGMIYPTFRVNVRAGTYGLDTRSPFSTFEFELKEWAANAAIFSGVGTVVIAWIAEDKGKAYSALFLAVLTLAFIILDAWLAIDIARMGIV